MARRKAVGQGTLRVALAFAAFLGSLSLVIWRQSRALEVLRELDAARVERAAVESDRSRQHEEIQHLESRSRVAAVAGQLWDMRVPSSDEEFVIMVRPELVEPSLAPVPRERATVATADLPVGNE
jgi:cell division protein FtsL